MKRVLIVLAILAMACPKPEQKTGKHFTIAVIPQGSTHEFWKSIHAGAMKAAQDEARAGVNVDIKIGRASCRERV